MEKIKTLIDFLDQQKSVYKALLDISKNKTSVIVEGKVQELEKITQVEQALVLNMSKLDEHVGKTLEEIRTELSITGQNNLSSIIEKLSGDEKSSLEYKKQELQEIITELDKANKINSNLIKSSLDYINFSVKLYTNANSMGNGGYGQNGDIQVYNNSVFNKKL